MQDSYFTKHYDKSQISNLSFFLLVLGFEDHFRFFMLFLSKYLNRNRKKFFDLNTVKKEEAVKNQSKVSKSGSATLSLVIALWLYLKFFDRFFLIEFYLYSSFCFNISLQFLSAAILKDFCLIAQEGFGSLIFKDAG